MLLKPQKDFSRDFLQIYNRALVDTSVVSRRDPKRLLNLRCSQLPFCPLGFFVDVSRNPALQALDFMGTFYTRVGTAVHEVMQTVLMQTSAKIVGDWTCGECGQVHKFTNQPECCGAPMTYEEICFDYKGIQGHLDTLFLVSGTIKKGEFWVVDYKTTSEKAKSKKAKNPGDAYVEQIITYAYLLRKQYGIKVTGVMLVFIPRDNPKSPVTYSRPITDKDLKKQAAKLKIYKQAHKAVLSAESKSDVLGLLDTFGTCSNPFCEVCPSRNPREILKTAYKAAKAKKTLPLLDAITKASTKKRTK
ncbi:exonuclease [Achromobacter phage Motura]|uniref:Exonuclease n=1 Tax=Achromobacter phage Motura TaxID=2591403 RepID=A0A514CSD6_9CAUD|nr:exonuclease [Achromobacter phage Motura]QDH83392.1 exonuclease [Achromobacter phage Motura]